jgi:hypothetical protein
MISNRHLKIFISIMLGLFPALAVQADIGSFFGKSPEVVATYKVKSVWQVTRAKFDRYGNASDSESYEDFWKLEVLTDGQAFLETHRQRVSVKIDQAEMAGANVGVPSAVLLSRDDFALLTGVQIPAAELVQKASEEQVRLVFGTIKQSEPIYFESPADEHIAVRLALGELERR